METYRAMLLVNCLGSLLYSTTAIYTAREETTQDAEATPLTWVSCNTEGAENVFRMDHLDITPMPLVTSRNMYITVHGELTREVGDVNVRVTFSKRVRWGPFSDNYFYWKIPCISEVGSCTYERACTRMNSTEANELQLVAEIKAMLHSQGVSTNCPLQPVSLSIDRFPILVPEVPSILSIISSGNYKIRAALEEHGTNTVMGCYEVQLGVTSPPKEETEVEENEMCSGWLCGRK